jgi:hypothetical protein
VTNQTLARLEADIDTLTFSEQIWLLERLAQRLRQQTIDPELADRQLEAMAADPAIQHAIREIDDEFRSARQAP